MARHPRASPVLSLTPACDDQQQLRSAAQRTDPSWVTRSEAYCAARDEYEAPLSGRGAAPLRGYKRHS